MKRILMAIAVLFLLGGSLAYAMGDLSRDNPKEVKMEMGTAGGKMYFRPNHIEFETGKAYKLVLINTDLLKHEVEAHEFVEKIFTRKVEVMGADGKMIAEIKGAVSEVEVAGKGRVEWYFVPIQIGKNVEMKCGIEGHKEAGMVGTITVK